MGRRRTAKKGRGPNKSSVTSGAKVAAIVAVPFAMTMLMVLTLVACSGGEAGVPAEGRPGDGPVLEIVSRGAEGLLRLEETALWESDDGGPTWESVPVPESASGAGLSGIAALVGDGGEIFLAGPFGVIRTGDGGASWQRADDELPTPVSGLAAHADSARILFAVAGDGVIYRTEDGGRSWRQMDGGPPGDVRALVHSNLPGSMNTGWLYAATDQGVARAMDCFCGWRPSGELPGGAQAVSAVAVDLGDPERVFAAGPSGVYGSEDAGESWRIIGKPAFAVRTLAVGDSGALYAGTADGRVAVSPDGGESWELAGA